MLIVIGWTLVYDMMVIYDRMVYVVCKGGDRV